MSDIQRYHYYPDSFGGGRILEHPSGNYIKHEDYQSLQAENTKLREALEEANTTMNHARVFIETREKMHPDGISLYDEALLKIETALVNSYVGASNVGKGVDNG